MLGVGAGVGLKSDVDISKMLKYLCDGQDTVRRKLSYTRTGLATLGNNFRNVFLPLKAKLF